MVGIAHAGGYAIDAQSTRTMGTALAGRAAAVEDAAAVFNNPALLVNLSRPEFTFNLAYFNFSTRLTDEGSTDLLGSPLSGESSRNGTSHEGTGALFYSHPLSDKWSVGFGMTVPFGLGTDYGDMWFGRYFATETRALFVNLNPVVAYKINKQWAVGGGVMIQYADATIANRIDFGSIGAGAGLTPQGSDGNIRFTGDSWAVGFNFGVTFQPVDGTRLGLNFRSRVTHNVKGDVDFTVPPEADPITMGGLLFQDGGARSRIQTPESVNLSLYQALGTQWAIVADVTWVGWSRVESLGLTFDNPAQPPIVQPADWNDTWRVSLGAIWTLPKTWILRTGIAWDPSPVPTSTREPRIPDGDRFWITFGASYLVSDKASIDFSYVVAMVSDEKSNISSALAGTLAANIDWAPVQILSLGFTYRF